jgi:hypothetical protein
MSVHVIMVMGLGWVPRWAVVRVGGQCDALYAVEAMSATARWREWSVPQYGRRPVGRQRSVRTAAA